MSRYSIWSLAAHALTGHRSWEPAWRDATPQAGYEVIIVGGGGHGLATAYYLAKNHGVMRREGGRFRISEVWHDPLRKRALAA